MLMTSLKMLYKQLHVNRKHIIWCFFSSDAVPLIQNALIHSTFCSPGTFTEIHVHPFTLLFLIIKEKVKNGQLSVKKKIYIYTSEML